jgi:subtilisin family serine protease
METKEYIVALHKGVDYDQFWAEMENSTSGLPHIPDRNIGIADNLLALDRITHYFLTDAEANTLRNDPRVLGVEIPAEHRDDIVIRPYATQTGTFTKTNSSSGNYVNWGLIRHSNVTNVYGSGTTTSLNYNYAADGTNVDVVILDSGIQADHPEFQYTGNTTSRVQQYQWDGTVNTSTFYKDYGGHGTHVAGISAGKTYGWAKNSNIYAIKFLPDAADPDQGFGNKSFGNVANIIAYWHSTVKSVNPATGYKNPTVVNMSFGYTLGGVANANPSYYTVANVNYRGSTYSLPTWSNSTYGLTFVQGSLPYRNPTYDVYLQVLTSANIVVCKSAGNDGQKIDSSSGIDYNNYVWVKRNSDNAVLGQYYYMQGGSPMDANIIVVGALDSTTLTSALDQKADYSNAGPEIDIFAAGSNILSCTSNISNLGAPSSTYFGNVNYKQININGTSMASPQVAGMVTLYLQANPTATPAQVKTWLLNNATSNIYANTANVGANDYGNTSSQWGGNAGVAYQAVQGLTRIKDATGTWKSVANVRVKTAPTTWSNVQAIWTKVDSTTWKQTF